MENEFITSSAVNFCSTVDWQVVAENRKPIKLKPAYFSPIILLDMC